MSDVSSQERFNRVVALLALSCAIIAVSVLLWSTFLSPTGSALGSERLLLDTLRIDDAQALRAEGNRWGTPAARNTVLVFTDFECPACRDFHLRALRGAMAEHGSDLSVVVRHWPLRSHRLATHMAIAAECAAVQGRFWPFQELVFEKQDSIGVLAVEVMAARAGVDDLAGFQDCRASTDIAAAISRSTAQAESLGGRGTPLILVNDLAIFRGIDSLGLDNLLRIGPALSK